ncbi:MAG: maleylpyruvate isomerase family mycothiol-dependent enzyme [Candidatus Dormiibacterota bacterium]
MTVNKQPGLSSTGTASGDVARSRDDQLWALAHAERTALAEDLSGLSAEQWRHGTLCERWDVEQVVAHLTAAASLNRWQWVRSMLGARFRVDVHNQRRLVEQLGSTPAETLDWFRAVIASTTAPSGHTPAYLGEIVVHAQDIRQPLGLPRTPDVEALTPVADFFARRDFAVASRTTVAGLQLRADDGPFATSTGPLVTGSTLALVMSMAGRAAYVDQLDGPGVATLRARVHGTAG